MSYISQAEGNWSV